METTKRKSVCFAYFGDGKFLGWYADTSGSIRSNSPKVYPYKESQVQVIRTNFQRKMKRLNEPSDLGKLHPGLSIMDEGLNADKTNLLQYQVVELRMVECPFYDGPNPDFDKVAYDKLVEERRQLMTEEGVFNIPAPSVERFDAVKAFDKKHPFPKSDNWVYADYSQVKEWASKEPTVFFEVVKA